MNRNRILHVILLLIFVALWSVILIVRRDPTKRNFRIIPQMEDSIAFESQREMIPSNKISGQTPNVPETIPRGFKPLLYSGTTEEARRAGRKLTNPYKTPTGALLKRGTDVYSNFCVVCHGKSGNGDGPVVKRGVPAPPSLFGQNARTMPDGRFFHILSFGQGNMPAYSSQISQEDRWKVILHVRSLQKTAASAAAMINSERVKP